MTRSLICVGCNIGTDVVEAVRDHDVCLLFEPIQEVAQRLVETFDCPAYSHKCIKIIAAAVYSEEGDRPFRIYNQRGLSSSLGTITAQAKSLYSAVDLSLQDERTVHCVRLDRYMPLRLTTLIIDAQGADLAILKSIEPWLEQGRIETIQAECDGDGMVGYTGLPDNSESEMLRYMAQFPHYECERVAGRVPWNPDFVWRLRENS